MKDIEIARQAKLKNILEITKKLNISEEYVESYGKHKAKVSYKLLSKLKNKKDGKLVLVTSINPTPLGEGKTTTSVGLADALVKIGKNSILALREPSLGPVFGMKGGATGGGYAQVAPMDEINLHFTGDIHAITTANNLLSAMIDNHIYWGNKLGIEKVTWKRCMDMNDRQLRKIECGLSENKERIVRTDGFDISVASEIMAIFCLASDLKDLKKRIGNIIIGYTKEEKPITASDLKAEGAMVALLKDAINPNMVQSLEGTPALIHGGPFANIAHGCNSVIATKLALKLSDYVITEAGFGADLGAEKFLDIKCRVTGLKPDAVVCVATIKALKYHGGIKKEDLDKEDIKGLDRGIHNVLKHIDNLKNKFGVQVVVAINRFTQDTDKELDYLAQKLKEVGVNLRLSEVWAKGGEGGKELAEEIVRLCEMDSKLNYIYELDDTIEDKILKVATKVYGAKDIEITKEAKEKIADLQKTEFAKLPICIAKTQYSFSDDPNNLECLEPFNLHISDVILKSGAGFITIITGKIMTMPGLPRIPSAESIDVDENENILGIF